MKFRPAQPKRCGTCYEERVVGRRNGLLACARCMTCSEARWEAAREELIRIERSEKERAT